MLRRILDVSALPLTLALQGVALALVAFISGSFPPSDPARIGSGDLPKPDLQAVGELRIPRDLARERLPVPRFPEFPDLDEPERAPKAAPESPKAPIAAGDRLAALRVSTVALAGLVSMDSPTPVPDAPDAIGLNEIGGSSGRSWLGGDRRTSRGNGGIHGPGESGDDGSGWGGTGIGGSGHGAGGSCPTPSGGRIGRPAGGSGGRVGRPGSPGGTTGGGGAGGGGGRPARGGDRPAKGGGSKR
jgi:hypothetical protein